MKRLLLVALMVLVTLVGMVGFSRAASDTASTSSNAVSALQATANTNNETVSTLQATVNDGVQAKHKMYYLTNNYFYGGEAITARDSGFHMASLSEIQDPGTVQYAPRRTPAYDSPYDSPAFDQASDQFPDHTGWVRTEADRLTGLVHNCDVWRSSSIRQSGTTMTRRSLWGENNGHSLYEESDPAAWWQSTRTASCSQLESVWCIEDPGQLSATKTSKSFKSTQ